MTSKARLVANEQARGVADNGKLVVVERLPQQGVRSIPILPTRAPPLILSPDVASPHRAAASKSDARGTSFELVLPLTRQPVLTLEDQLRDLHVHLLAGFCCTA